MRPKIKLFEGPAEHLIVPYAPKNDGLQPKGEPVRFPYIRIPRGWYYAYDPGHRMPAKALWRK